LLLKLIIENGCVDFKASEKKKTITRRIMDMHDFHDCLASDACELDPGRLSFTTPSHLARVCRQRDSIILLKQLLGILVVPTLDRS
jgi:hypothetical protein